MAMVLKPWGRQGLIYLAVGAPCKIQALNTDSSASLNLVFAGIGTTPHAPAPP